MMTRHTDLERTLRESVNSARVAPSPELRRRTLEALKNAPAPVHTSTPNAARVVRFVWAGAAVCALAVIAWIIVGDSAIAPLNPHDLVHRDRTSQSPQGQESFEAQPLALRVTVTAPLLQEARHLAADAERLVADFRRSLPKLPRRGQTPVTEPAMDEELGKSS